MKFCYEHSNKPASKAVRLALGGKGNRGEEEHSPPTIQAAHVRATFCLGAAKQLGQITDAEEKPTSSNRLGLLSPGAHRLTGRRPHRGHRPDTVGCEPREKCRDESRVPFVWLQPVPAAPTALQAHGEAPVPPEGCGRLLAPPVENQGLEKRSGGCGSPGRYWGAPGLGHGPEEG